MTQSDQHTAFDPNRFHEFEHQGWQEVALRYDDTWALVTKQSIEPLLNAAHVSVGTRILDVACGPGYVAGAALARGATAVGIDFSSIMIEEARRRYAGVEFREGDAENLAFPDGSFDAVVVSFGMLHLARPERALSEAQRVLRSGGRVAFTVWETPDRAVAHGIVLRAIQKHGDLSVPIPPGPPFFRFSDPKEVINALQISGFTNPSVSCIDQVWHLPSADALFEVMYHSSVRNAALLRAQKPEVLQAIRDTIGREVETYHNALPMPAVLASADRP